MEKFQVLMDVEIDDHSDGAHKTMTVNVDGRQIYVVEMMGGTSHDRWLSYKHDPVAGTTELLEKIQELEIKCAELRGQVLSRESDVEELQEESKRCGVTIGVLTKERDEAEKKLLQATKPVSGVAVKLGTDLQTRNDNQAVIIQDLSDSVSEKAQRIEILENERAARRKINQDLNDETVKLKQALDQKIEGAIERRSHQRRSHPVDVKGRDKRLKWEGGRLAGGRNGVERRKKTGGKGLPEEMGDFVEKMDELCEDSDDVLKPHERVCRRIGEERRTHIIQSLKFNALAGGPDSWITARTGLDRRRGGLWDEGVDRILSAVTGTPPSVRAYVAGEKIAVGDPVCLRTPPGHDLRAALLQMKADGWDAADMVLFFEAGMI